MLRAGADRRLHAQLGGGGRDRTLQLSDGLARRADAVQGYKHSLCKSGPCQRVLESCIQVSKYLTIYIIKTGSNFGDFCF